MRDEQRREWEELGRLLAELAPEKFDDALAELRHAVAERKIVIANDAEFRDKARSY